MNFSSPKLETGSIITTFQTNIQGMTPKKLYVVEKYNNEFVTITDDLGELIEVRKIFVMEADIVFTILFLSTLNRLFNDIL